MPGDVIIGTLGDPNLRACILPPCVKVAVNKADCIQVKPDQSVMTAEYLWTYVYDDAGELLYEASSYREQAQQVEMLSQEPPEGSKGDPPRTPR